MLKLPEVWEPLCMLSPYIDLEAAIFAAWVGARQWLPCPWLANTAANAPTYPQLPALMTLSRSSMDDGVDERAANANDDVSPAEEALFCDNSGSAHDRVAA